MTWEFLPYWRSNLIKEKQRQFMKKMNQLKYDKADWLSLSINRSYRLNIMDIQIDWERSFEFIMKDYNEDLNDMNNERTAYKLKNFLEILPVMDILNKRNPEVYESSRCCKYVFTHKIWTHIWICKKNETTINNIINEAFGRSKNYLDCKDYRLSFNYHASLFQVLNDRSFMVFNGRIFHEAIKGLINEKLYLGIKDKVFKDAIKMFVAGIMDFSREYIWIPRCKQMIEWERTKGTTRQMKQNAKFNRSCVSSLGDARGSQKRFFYDILNRWIGHALENTGKLDDNWNKIEISDLWKFNDFINFRSSRYANEYPILD